LAFLIPTIFQATEIPIVFFSFLHMLLLLLLVSRIGYIIITRQEQKRCIRSDLLTPTPPLIVQGHHGRFVGRPSFYSPPPHPPYLFFSSTPGRMGRRFSENCIRPTIFWRIQICHGEFCFFAQGGWGSRRVDITVRYYYDYYMDGRIGWLRI
jgi:hypothetical protein